MRGADEIGDGDRLHHPRGLGVRHASRRAGILSGEVDLAGTDLDPIAGVETRQSLDQGAIQLGPVLAFEILNPESILTQKDLRVFARYGRIVDDDAVVRSAAEREGTFAREPNDLGVSARHVDGK